MPDLDKFERSVFVKKNALDLLLKFSMHLMQARQVGLLYGTNRSGLRFLSPEKWDRGVMHKFNGRGAIGLLFKYLGTFFVRYKGLSPVRLYKDTQFGEKKENDGIISFILRKHKEFYGKGIKILIIDNLRGKSKKKEQSSVSILSYNGEIFKPLTDLKINTAIVNQFKAENFVSAYIPDYGAIAFNTINKEFLEKKEGGFVHEKELKKRLDMLISAIEMASLANIGSARGRQAAHIIWRKEKSLRKTALDLKLKEVELEHQKKYLKAVGAVNEAQLNMEAVNIADGVYAFMDMVGSATIRRNFSPRDYFYILNLCHQITANNANQYGCRVDNFIGDGVFLQNSSPFDRRRPELAMGSDERVMLMVLAISSTFNEIHQLKKGQHHMDPGGRVKRLISDAQVDIGFRAGMEIGSSMIGPLGSRKRKIVTAIGKAVNNASRLESSGTKDWIHVSERILTIIKHSYITKDTCSLSESVKGFVDIKDIHSSGGMSFLEYYKTRISTDEGILKEQKNVSYKEFSKDVSFLIRCLPGNNETDQVSIKH